MSMQYIAKLTNLRPTILTSLVVCASLVTGNSLHAQEHDSANEFMETVVIGNRGNEAKEVSVDTGLVDSRWFKSGNFGSVPYQYRIGKTEVTNDQYTVFLNAVAETNRQNLFHQQMQDDPRGGIIRSGENGSYTFSTKPNMGDKPVIYITFWDSLRFCNWMHNGMPTTGKNLNRTATEDGAYPLLGRTIPKFTERSFNHPKSRKPSGILPNEDEWFKAAYHMNDGVTGNYFDYPTASNEQPLIATADEFGNVSNPGANVVNYANGADWNSLNGNVTTVASAGSPSAYGTFDQAGNVDEWTETQLWVTSATGGPRRSTVWAVLL